MSVVLGPVPGIGGRRDGVALEELVVEQSSLIVNILCHHIVKIQSSFRALFNSAVPILGEY